MNRRRLLRLWSDAALVCYIRQQARRHFARIEDQEDAVSEVWEKLSAERRLPSDVRHFAYRIIKNAYDRALYQHREIRHDHEG